MGMNDINSLAHTKWNCKYHIVFAPKYRRKVFYQEKREAVGKILRRLCEWKGVRIVEAGVCPDHIHMLVEIPPKIAVPSFMGYLKGKSSTMLYEQFSEWYYVDTVGKNESRIAEYIENQLKEDEMGEQLTMSQCGPFTGASNNPAQLADRTYAFDACARNIGLCSHKQNHPLGGWMLFLFLFLHHSWYFSSGASHGCNSLFHLT